MSFREIISSFIVLASLCQGCSIKEDRADCPRIVVVDMSEVDAWPFIEDGCEKLQMGLQSVGPGDYSSSLGLALSPDGLPGECEFEAPREELRFYAQCCGGTLGALIPLGSDCPVVYGCTQDIDAGSDVTVPLQLHKQFCTINILFKEGPLPSCEYSVTGSVCGYDVFGQEVPGDFGYTLRPGSDGRCSVRVPRQADNSLRLRITGDGYVVRIFAIGEYIAQSGYDWTAEDLEDIDLTVSFTSATAAFEIDMWQKTVTIDVQF